MDTNKLLYSGKAKEVYDYGDNKVLLKFTNNITAFNNKRKDIIDSKGEINTKISTMIFKYLEKNNIKTHFIKELDNSSHICEHLKIIPLEVIVRNIARGSIVKKFNLEPNYIFSTPIVEFSFKDDALNDPQISENQIIGMNILNKKDLEFITEESLKINVLLKKLFLKINIELADFKIEFGRNHKDLILLGDEISPDCMRLLDIKTKESLDKDVYRENKGDVVKSYQEILRRLSNEINN